MNKNETCCNIFYVGDIVTCRYINRASVLMRNYVSV